MRTGIIILGHGSKAPEALETLIKVREQVKTVTGNKIVEIASLQFNRPDLAQSIENVVKQGVERIIIVPMFLYFGIHLKEDIPEILEKQRKKYPGVHIVMAKNLGADSRIADILLDRIKEVS